MSDRTLGPGARWHNSPLGRLHPLSETLPLASWTVRATCFISSLRFLLSRATLRCRLLRPARCRSCVWGLGRISIYFSQLHLQRSVAHTPPLIAPLHYGTPPTSIPYHQRRRGNLLTAVDTASLAPFLTMRLTGAMSSAPYARLVWIATRLAGLGNTWSGLGLGKG